MVEALLDLYASAGGANWTRTDNWLEGEPCVDSWFGITCCPAAYPLLRAARDQGTGGHVCTSRDGRDRLIHDASMCVSAGELGACHVVGVALRNNSLAGTLGEGLATTLTRLQRLELDRNQLSGPLPASLALLGDEAAPMQRLALSDNGFDYSGTNENELLRLVQRCKEGATFSCAGLPPVSCSAFGAGYMVRAHEPDTCERCPALWISAVLMTVGSVLMGGGLALYVWVISRYHHPNRGHHPLNSP